MINSLSIVIPSYNEGKRLSQTLSETIIFLNKQHLDYEIIVVSDGSCDNTDSIVDDLSKNNNKITLIKNGKNMGKGYSVRRGILASSKEYILFMDADNSTPISELPKFSKLSEKYNVLIGSRALPQSKIIISQSKLRNLTGKLINLAIRFLFLPEIHDTQCGFKIFKRQAAIEIFKRAQINRFVFDVEILCLAKDLQYSIIEVPIIWTNSSLSKVSFYREFFNIIFDLIKIKFNRKFIVTKEQNDEL